VFGVIAGSAGGTRLRRRRHGLPAGENALAKRQEER
jgi:hypothetical protein